MSYKIELSYDNRFVELFSELKQKYGQDLFNLDGIGNQLDLNLFRQSFFNADVTSDISVDPNANVDDTSIIAYNTEFSKPVARLDSYYTLWEELCTFLSEEEAAEIIESQLVGDIYINDFHGIASGAPYCFNYSALDVLSNGLPMVKKIMSIGPKHLLAFKSQLEQFITVASNSTLGATGLADMLIAFSYFMDKILETHSDAHIKFASEEDCWTYLKETLVSFIYTVNQPMRANQSPFTNVSLYDRPFLESITKDIVFVDGSTPNLETIEKIQIIFMDAMNEESRRTPITFPITTACFSVKDGELLDKNFVELIAKKNLEFGFINMYIGETSTLSSCCRLRSSTENEFFNSYGAGSSKIGSLGVVTINFPRLAFLTSSDEEFEQKLRHLVQMTAKINHAKRNIVKRRIESGHMPLYTLGFMELKKQYSTTGVNGFYEALMLRDHSILTADGENYATHLMTILNEEIDAAQALYKAPHNCEQVPGENASIKLCKKDKYLGYDLDLEFYSNQFVPLTVPTDMLNRINIQGKLESYFSGGSVLHLNIEEGIEDYKDLKSLIEYCAKSGVVYFAFNYLLNKCENNHMTTGHRDNCSVCGARITGQYIRVVGFLTQVAFWHKTRRELDFPNRVFYNAKELKEFNV